MRCELSTRSRPGRRLCQYDVHRSKEQRIRQFASIGEEPREQPLADAKTLGERARATHYFSGGLQKPYGRRAHDRVRSFWELPALLCGSPDHAFSITQSNVRKMTSFGGRKSPVK
jgi:hypothetical protein